MSQNIAMLAFKLHVVDLLGRFARVIGLRRCKHCKLRWGQVVQISASGHPRSFAHATCHISPLQSSEILQSHPPQTLTLSLHRSTCQVIATGAQCTAVYVGWLCGRLNKLATPLRHSYTRYRQGLDINYTALIHRHDAIRAVYV